MEETEIMFSVLFLKICENLILFKFGKASLIFIATFVPRQIQCDSHEKQNNNKYTAWTPALVFNSYFQKTNWTAVD